MNRNNILNFTTSFLLALLVGMTSPAYADDTEIYFTDTSSDSVGQPNVLFILDTSSSMSENDVIDDKGTSDTSDDENLGPRLDVMKDALRNIISNIQGVNVGLMRFHRYGGPVLYPVAPINADVSTVETSVTNWDVVSSIKSSSDDAEQLGSTVVLNELEHTVTFEDGVPSSTLQVEIAASGDDVEGSASTYDTTSSDLEILKESDTQIIGLRFNGVNIPAGATVHNARIELRHDPDNESNSPQSYVLIWADRAANAGAFSNFANLQSRVANAAATGPGAVVWEDIDEIGATHGSSNTPDLSVLVQDVVNLGGWSSGNSMAFLFAEDPGVSYSKDTKRVFGSYDDTGEGRLPAKLVVTYSFGAVGSTGEKTVGLRFTGLNIPQGVKVTDAYLEFVAAGVTGDAEAQVHIRGEDVGDASTFSTASGNITGRTRTTAEVDWTVPVVSATGEFVRSENIAPVIQEITSRSDWCGGNNLALFLDPVATGNTQFFASFDSSSSVAPILRVKFSHTEDLVDGTNGCVSGSAYVPITSGIGDVEQRSNKSLYDNSTDLELMNDEGTSDLQEIGLHFKNIPVVQGAVINSAFIEFVSRGTHTASRGNITIEVEDNASPADFQPGGPNNQVTGRDYINGKKVNWDPEPWSVSGKAYRTADIKALVQAVVDKPEWDSGDAMVFMLDGNSGAIRRAWSYEGDSSYAARLIVDFQGFFDPNSSESATILTVRDRLLEVVDELEWKGGTPIVDALLEGVRYMRGDPVAYGLVRGDQGSRSEFTRVSHPDSYTGGNVVRDSVCDSNPNDVACISEKITGNPVYKSPMSECQENILVLLSDGEASVNTAESAIENLITTETGSGYNCVGSYDLDEINEAGEVTSTTTHTVASKEVCGVDLTKFVYEEDQSELEGFQNIKTYSIGFNYDGPFIQAIATASRDPDVTKAYFTAKTAEQLTAVFNNIFQAIEDDPTSQAAPSLSVNAFNRLFNRNEVYFSLFKPAFEKAWIGNVKKYRVCTESDPDVEGDCTLGDLIDAQIPAKPIINDDLEIVSTAQSFWGGIADGPTVDKGGAGGQVPGHGARVIYTFNGDTDLTASINAVTVANAATVGDPGSEGISTSMLGMVDEGTTQADLAEMINWVRGQDVDDEDDDSNTSENRWTFADPLHGGPLPITYGGTEDKPVIKLFVGANDGSFRQIDAETGHEDWVFFPPETLMKQAELRENRRDDHVYGIDGVPTAWVNDTDRDGIIEPSQGEFVYLYVGQRRGGANYYALDVTPTTDQTPDENGDVATTLIEPKLLWTITGGIGDFVKLGQSWSRPKVAQIRVTTSGSNTGPKQVLIFGGGYDTDLDNGNFTTTDKGNAIFIVDAETGDRLWWASHGLIGGVVGTNSGADLEFDDMLYAVPSDIALLDSDGDGQTDRLYFGDTGGQVWRIDLGDQIGANSPDVERVPSGGRIAVLSDPGVPEDRRKFFFAPDVLQVKDHIYSNVDNYDLVMIASGDRAKPLEKVVHNRAYAIRDYNITGQFDEANQGENQLYPLMHGGDGDNDGSPDFFNATDNLIQVGSESERNVAQASLQESDGWFMDLSENGVFIGEKALASPVVLAGIMFFTTYLPQASEDPCAPNVGQGRLFAVNALNAAAVFEDWGGEANTFETGDRVYDLGAGIPSAAVPIFQKKGITLLVGGGGGAASIDPNIDLPRVRTFWSQE